jgi:protein-L-isoaspartate(D-aspartate) O-methyltransferase
MLDLLDTQPGNTVFEIGTGSGWNAALMGQLVGQQGHVYSMEIFPDLVHSSQQALQRAGGQSVTILAGDGALGYASGAPFDRIIFTAGSYDIPLAFHQQLKEDGLLLAVLKLAGGGDDLVLFISSRASWFLSTRPRFCLYLCWGLIGRSGGTA